ncbi:DMT family transporter [Pasteurellaceae bacterium LIM206]|nr:DMT family transporter [Pasteurellaceae bacterium LIM206]
MFYLILAVLIWASAFIAGKFSYTMMDPALMVQARIFLAALFAVPFFVSSYRKIPSDLRSKMWLLALLNFPIVLLLQFIGLSYTSAASAVTMLGTEPLLVALVGQLVFRLSAKPVDWILGVIAFIGIVLVVTGSESGGEISLFGCILVLLGSLAFAFCIHLSKGVMKEVDPRSYTNVMLIFGTILCLPFTLLLVRDWTIIPSWEGSCSVLYLGIGCTWLAYRLWNKGLTRVTANASSIIATLEPVFGVLLAMLVLGEKPEWITAFGIILVIGAAATSALSPIWQAWLKKKTAGTRQL